MPRRNDHYPVYGALDLGTNNCRLLIARPALGGFKVIDAFSRIVRLGEGVSGSGRLSELAMSRTIDALRVCAGKLAWQNVSRWRLIATEACRMAANGSSFIDRVERETGLRLEIIDRSLEAELAVAGSAALLAPDARTALVFDIGGGSTELMWLALDRGSYRIVNWTSLPFGVVTLAEMFGGIDVTPEDFDAMLDYVEAPLRRFAEVCGAGPESPPDHLLGTSGTVTTIAGVHLSLMRYDRNRVDGCWLKREDVRRVTRQLLAMSYAERAASPCIGKDRADLVLAGCAILEGIQALWPSELIRVADRGLREGILTTLMVEDGTFGIEPGHSPALAELGAI
ncbi:Ppx/GppA phosphatase family protein [Rhodoligotrophos ferricapiens]|uniref:Ppx/GppA phosphatase family protein n=1 Tax=Rhodoligotrophos ferricapiens TaxID=3069264 RepID=UPI003D815D85